MKRLRRVAEWLASSIAALAFGWSVGGHFDWFTAAGALALVVWKLCASTSSAEAQS